MPNHLVARATKTTSALTVERSKDLLRKRDELICAQQRHPRVAIVALGLRLVAILLEHRLRVAVPAHLGSSFFMSLQPPFQAILMTQQRGKLLARLSQTPLLRKARRVDLRLQLLGQTRPVHPPISASHPTRCAAGSHVFAKREPFASVMPVHMTSYV